MTNEWTPEPWPENLDWSDEWSVAIDRPDYTRARACVNALAGMNPEAVADVVREGRALSAGVPTPMGDPLRAALARLDKVEVEA